MKKYILLLFCHALILETQAQTEIQTQQLWQGQITAGKQTAVYDEYRFTSAGKPASLFYQAGQGKLRSSRAVVSLYVNPDLPIPYQRAYRVTLKCQLDHISAEPTLSKKDTFSLSIDYSADAGNVKSYRSKDVFTADGAVWSRLTIISKQILDDKGNTLSLGVADSAIFALRHQLQLERYRTPGTQSPRLIAAPASCKNLHLKFKWEPVKWAVEYDLEWTYVDDYQYSSNIPKPIAGLEYHFRHNATRVRIKTTEYEIPTVFERGYVVCRVRAVGRIGEDFKQVASGEWTKPESGYLSAADLNVSVFRVDQGFEQDRMNWQYEAVFTEEGKRKDLLRFADGTNRIRQEQTNLNTEKKLLVAETVYDHIGRPAVQILPAPIQSRIGWCPTNESPAMRFQSGFNQNTDKKPYSWADFERNGASGCDLEARPLETGAAVYYGPKNPNQAGRQAFLPDSEGFPFVQTQFTPDNTGRIQRQGGLGKDFQLGKGHEQRYFYGVPAQEELDRILGNEAGFSNHYQKTAMLDANGQMHLEYTNLAGQVVATAFAGATPANLTDIERTAPAATILIDLISEDNRREGDALVASRQVIISQPTTATFAYRLTPNRFSPACPQGASLCYDCVYDLDVRITDDCGQAVFQLQQRIGDLNAVASCESVPFVMPTQTLSLKPGNYFVTKRLSVHAPARTQYVSHYLQQPCILNLKEQWIKEERDGIDPELCDAPPCTTCRTLPPEATKPVTVSITQEDGTPTTVTFNPQELAKTDGGCMPACPGDAHKVAEFSALHSLISDIAPGGQYAEYKTDDPTNPVNPDRFELSVLSEGNKLPITGRRGWREPFGFYADNNGDTTRIEISAADVEAGRYDGAAPSPNAEGRYFILPEKLHRVEDFIEKWQSSWAMALLPYHPEYGYYVWTDSNKVSYEYDAQLLSTHLYSEASSGGMTNHLAAGLGFDPYFIAHPAAAALMMDSLRLADSINYRTTPGGPLIRRFFSIEDLTYISARCNNPVFNGAQMVACLGGNRPFGSATTADAEWNIYRGIYLSKKMAVLDRERRAWVAAVGAYNNDYIGTVSGGPYRNKIKRFPSPSDTTQFRDEHGAAFDGPFALRRYQEQRLKITCGICPIAKDLETVLFALAYQGRLVSPIRFPEGPLLSLPLSLIQQFSVPADLQYEWRPTVASGTVLQIEIWATNAKRNVCTLRLTKDTDAVAWKDIRFFNCMQAQSDTEFTLNAYDAEMTKVEVRGFVSCFKLKTCPSVTQSPVCLKLPLADDFAAFLNYMFQPASPRRYPQKSLLVHRKGAPSTYFSKALEKYHPAGTEWVWNYRSGDLKTRFVADYLIRANQQTLVSCSLDFSIVGTGFVFDDIRRIIQISKGSESSPNVFFLTALTATGRTFLIRVQQSGCFQFFNCAPLNDNTPESPLLCCIPMAPPVQVSQPSCMERLGQIAASHATRRFETYVEQLRDSIGNAYTERCLAAAEQARLQYTDAIYQYTLFYYDRAGNLTKTIPPKGVVLLSAAQMTQTANFRNKTGSTPVYPAHRMASTYLYNSLNAAIQRITPDDGRTRTCYDQVGRVILSQDAQQFKDRACTYLTYDPHGRVLETGRLATLPVGALIPARLSYKEAFLPNWYNAYTRSEIYRTQYDYPLSDKVYAYFEAGQKHLRNRIASVTFQQVSSGTYDHAMHYGYDVLGNIREFVQESVRLFKEYKSVPAVAAQAVKTIRYQYDQHSGIVTQSIYQPGKADQFVHWYEYDADNRVQTVLTSTNLYDDPVLRDREAKYAYYDHGPLARIEIGSERVQGIDYAYTLQGWLKGINSVLDDPARDMGSDGGGSSPFAADAYGFALGYRQGDYKPIGARHFLPRYEAPAVNAVEQDSRDLWDGNIQYTLSRIAGLSRPVTANVYSYDQAQRIRSSRFYAMQATPAGRYNTDGLPWQSQTAYATDYEYDPNGNITRLRRRGESSNLFDNLSYNYANVQQNNRLSNITDSGVRLPDNSDLANQVNNNYAYDDKGRLLWDLGENSNLRWSNTDKLTTYTRSGKTTRFYYDALGRRAAKIISDKEQVLYIRDALGNVLAEYRIDKNRVFWQNSPIYAPGRIGMYQPEKELPADAPDSRRSGDRRGLRLYELGSHTGDVLAVVSDRRLPAPPAGGTAAAVADLRHAEDYYPFGMPMPGRAMAGAGYRYGFQGMERDDDLKGRGNSYTTEFRQYDARVGRWLSVDPEGTRFPEVSPYVAHLNNSNQFIDRDGDVPINVLVDNVTASRIKNWYLEVQEYGPNGQLGEKQIIPGRVINNHMVQFEAHSIPRNGIYRVSSIYFLTPIKINGLDSRLPIIGSGQITSGSLTISSNRLEASGNLLILDIATKDAVNLQLELEGSGEPGGIGIAGTGAAGITVGRVPTGEGELKLGDPRQPESEAHSQNRETNFQSREHGAIGRSNEQAATRTARARSAVRGERVTVPERARRPARDRSSRNRRQTPTINITCQNNCTINVDSDRNTTTNSTNDERK